MFLKWCYNPLKVYNFSFGFYRILIPGTFYTFYTLSMKIHVALEGMGYDDSGREIWSYIHIYFFFFSIQIHPYHPLTPHQLQTSWKSKHKMIKSNKIPHISKYKIWRYWATLATASSYWKKNTPS